MKFLEAAERVLEMSGRPMRPADIVREAKSKGWLSSSGQTPAETMHSRLACHVKKGGKVFVRTEPGVFFLSRNRPPIEQPSLVDKVSKDSGYVYILTNPSFRRDWVKIGMTERPVNTRSKELDNTAVPLPFEIYATLKTNHRRKIEHLLHGSIDDIAPQKRIRKTREFFNIAPETALRLLFRAAEVFDEERYIDEVFKHRSENAPSKGRRVRGMSTYGGNSFKNVSQLAKYIAIEGGNIGAANGLMQLLSARKPCKTSSKWRKPFERLGIQFDAKDFVRDWTCAKAR